MYYNSMLCVYPETEGIFLGEAASPTTHYQRIHIRFDVLNTELEKPSWEKQPAPPHDINGFQFYLMLLIRNQREMQPAPPHDVDGV